MAKRTTRRTPTVSISLTPELLAAVNSRVESGRYSSVSELLRAALRQFLDAEGRRNSSLGTREPGAGAGMVAEGPAARFASANDLAAFGAQMQQLRGDRPDADDTDLQKRVQAAQDELEADRVIRPSPERLRRLREGHGSD